jgi:ADP-ribose pyrophosphatase
MEFKLISTSTLYRGRVFNLRQDTLEYQDGQRYTVDVVEHAGAVVFLPMEADNSVWFVRQYRHAVGQELLELPAGGLNGGEDPQQAAIRECREEVGLAPGQVVALGQTFLAPGYSSELLHYFAVSELKASPLPQDEDERLSTERIPWDQALHMLENGDFLDAKTVVGLSLARFWLARQSR